MAHQISESRPKYQLLTGNFAAETNSPSTSPATHTTKKTKHVVGHGNGGRTHTRVPSKQGLTKLAKGHGNDGSHTDLKKLAKGGGSSTNLKKNSSHVSLKRNRSAADVKRPKSSSGAKGSVHFDIGDADDQWEEASSSASPALSRSATTASHPPSAKSSANNSRPQSPLPSPLIKTHTATDGQNEAQYPRQPSTNGKNITERLLKRTPSHNTTKMSLATATPISHPDELNSVRTPTTLSGSKEEIVSRFVGASETPSDGSPFLTHHPYRKPSHNPSSSHDSADDIKRAKSMGNLTRAQEDGDSALATHSRKGSTGHGYIPPQQSRTQQKLWLQRASSNIEPQQLQMAPSAALNGLGLHGTSVFPLTSSTSSLVGDSRDPRIRLQLERTGLEYLVVRRHQDPVGKALKRLEQIPGVAGKRIPAGSPRKKGDTGSILSQSLRERRGGKSARSSFDGEESARERTAEEDGAGAILRSLWEKSFDLSASAD